VANKELTGEVARIVFSSETGDWAIIALKDGTIAKGPITPGSIVVKHSYLFSGKHESDPKYGNQFSFNAYTKVIGKDPYSVVNYITATCRNCQIGPAAATRIVDKFGPENAVAVMRSNPGEIIGIAPRLNRANAEKASELLTKAFVWESTSMALMQLFAGRGFTQAATDACIELWGVEAPDRIRKDPLSMLVNKIPSAGFQRVNAMYNDLGLPPNRIKRQMILIWWSIKQSMSGSTWHKWSDIKPEVLRLVTGRVNLKKAVKLGVRARWLIVAKDGDDTFIASRENAEDEESIISSIGYLTGE
tara:strand:+ start:1098 stop:2006 length:909 start_codon:yes stop_codon:yes gene_type:complete